MNGELQNKLVSSEMLSDEQMKVNVTQDLLESNSLQVSKNVSSNGIASRQKLSELQQSPKMNTASVFSERKDKKALVGSDNCDIKDGDLSSNNQMGPYNLLKNDGDISLHDGSLYDERDKSADKKNDMQTPGKNEKADLSFDDDDLDIPDDDDLDLNIQMPDNQAKIIASNKVLKMNAPELNDPKFRQAYMKNQVSNQQLIERRKKKQEIVKKHAEEVKDDTKKNLVFKFVRQNFIA